MTPTFLEDVDDDFVFQRRGDSGVVPTFLGLWVKLEGFLLQTPRGPEDSVGNVKQGDVLMKDADAVGHFSWLLISAVGNSVSESPSVFTGLASQYEQALSVITSSFQ